MAIQFGSRQPGLDSDLNFNLTAAAITPIDGDSHACFLHINHDHRLCTPAHGTLTLVLDRLSFGVQDVTHYGAPWPLISLPNVPPDRKNVNIGVDCDTQALDPRIQAQTMVHLRRQRSHFANSRIEDDASFTSMWFTSKYVGYIGEALFLNSLVGFRELSGISAYGGNIDNTIYHVPRAGLHSGRGGHAAQTLTPALCPVLRTGAAAQRRRYAMHASCKLEHRKHNVSGSRETAAEGRTATTLAMIRLDDVKAIGLARGQFKSLANALSGPGGVAFLVSAQADLLRAQHPRMPLRHSAVVVSAQHDALEPASALESMQCDSSSACTGTAGAHKCKRDTTCDLHRVERARSAPDSLSPLRVCANRRCCGWYDEISG
ncbi:hypothetical protein C8R43DRAFT_1142915 [Mycena crocata]|nr:hypothetical protein C8R43DRAFT_1142915 [Mycena crocata]